MESTEFSNEYNIEWLGYNNNPNHNRIWGFLKMKDGRYYAFWGVKGRRMQFKLHDISYGWRLSILQSQKENKGYTEINPSHYEIISPGFQQDLELWLTTNILADSLR